MYLAVIVGRFVKQDVREWCPSTTGPVTSLGFMAVSNRSWRGVGNVGRRTHHRAEQKSGADEW